VWNVVGVIRVVPLVGPDVVFHKRTEDQMHTWHRWLPSNVEGARLPVRNNVGASVLLEALAYLMELK